MTCPIRSKIHFMSRILAVAITLSRINLFAMSASLIGRLGSSAFKLTTTAGHAIIQILLFLEGMLLIRPGQSPIRI